MTTQTIRPGFAATRAERLLLRIAIALEAATVTRILSRAGVRQREAWVDDAADRRRDAGALGAIGILPR